MLTPATMPAFSFLVIHHGSSVCSVRNYDLYRAAVTAWGTMAAGTPVRLVQYLPGAPAYPAPGDFVEPDRLPLVLSDFQLDSGATFGGVLVDNAVLALTTQVCSQGRTLSYLNYVSTQTLPIAPSTLPLVLASSGPCAVSGVPLTSAAFDFTGEGLFLSFFFVVLALTWPWVTT